MQMHDLGALTCGAPPPAVTPPVERAGRVVALARGEDADRDGTGNGRFMDPTGVATDAGGNVYVADSSNHRIQKFTPSCGFITQWGSFGTSDGLFRLPTAVATDPAGSVYVADTFNGRIQKFSSSGAFITKWGSNGTGDGQFNIPTGVATDPFGSVYVADRENHRIQKFRPVQ